MGDVLHNRRADLPMADAKDVRWVHGTAIGTARSRDGVRWRYFVQQSGEPQSARDPEWHRRSVLQIAELKEAGGILTVDRDAPTEIPLARR